jgi:hypothetical protein
MIERRLLLLLMVAGILGAYSVYNHGETLLDRFKPQEQAARAANAGTLKATTYGGGSVVNLNPVSGIDVAALNDMIERPLFNPTRAPKPRVQPPPVVEAAAPAVVEDDINPKDFTLLAVAATEADKTALVRWNSADKVFHLKRGQLLSDWEVLEVGDREVTLGKGGKSVQIKLFQKPAAAILQPDDGEDTDEPSAKPQ